MENTETKINRINLIAVQKPETRFLSLKYLLNDIFLMNCFNRLKRRRAPGVDGRTKESYEPGEMEKEIHKMVVSMKMNTYRPQPVRRVEIPKENGKKRALGIPTVLDKVGQEACGEILQAIWEPKLLDVSFGYRPNRDAHGAVKAVHDMLMIQRVNYILEADIKGFFDHVDHTWMRKFLALHILDSRFLNLITSMLKAGVMTQGKVMKATEGTPQGGIISPILANIYLHYILDLWFEKRMKKQVRGFIQLIRYADDFIIGCQYREDAEKLLQDIQERFAKFGLSLSMDKTKVLEFGRFASENRKRRGQGKPETFDFLGFTHYCGVSRKGAFAPKVKTARKRMKRALHAMNEYMKKNRSKPLKLFWEMTAMKVRGHYQYYSVSDNSDRINMFYQKTRKLAFMWLNKRSQRKSFTWKKFTSFLRLYPLPKPRLYYALYNTN